jgi:hypothetical protein
MINLVGFFWVPTVKNVSNGFYGQKCFHQGLLLLAVEVPGGLGDLGGDGQEVVGQHVGRGVHDYGLGEAGEAVHPLGALLVNVVVDEHQDVAEDFVGQLRCDARDLAVTLWGF